MQATSRVKSSSDVLDRRARSTDTARVRRSVGWVPAVAKGRLARQRRVQLARWCGCGWWRGEVNSSDESSSSSRGGPLGRWLSRGSSLALGPLRRYGRAKGRNLGWRRRWMRWRRCHGGGSGGEVVQTAAVVVDVRRGGQASEVRSVTRLLSLSLSLSPQQQQSSQLRAALAASQPARQGFGR